MNRQCRFVVGISREAGFRGLFLSLLFAVVIACSGVDVEPGVRGTASTAIEPALPDQPVDSSVAAFPNRLLDPSPPAVQEGLGLPEGFPTDIVVSLEPYARFDLPTLIDHGEQIAIGVSSAYLRNGGWINERTGSGKEYVMKRSWDEDALTLTFEGNGRWMRLIASSVEGEVDLAYVIRMAEDFVQLGWAGWYRRYHDLQRSRRAWRFRGREATGEDS